MSNTEQNLSILVADVPGRVRLHEKLGAAEAMRAVDRCLKRMERVVQGCAGRLIKTAGEELVAVFLQADDALQAALEMQVRVSDLPPVSGVQMTLRVGLMHGLVTPQGSQVDGDAAQLAVQLAALAKPGQILLGLEAKNALSAALRGTVRELEPSAQSAKFGSAQVFEVVESDFSVLELKHAAAGKKAAAGNEAKRGDAQRARLCLRYAGQVTVLDDKKLLIRMGRDAESDVVIHDRRASRHHAVIEHRGGRFFLSDKSTNGTFVTLNGASELMLRKDECVIHGKGVIGFAASASGPDVDYVEFEQL